MDLANLVATLVAAATRLGSLFGTPHQRSYSVRCMLCINGFEHLHLRRLAFRGIASELFSPLDSEFANGLINKFGTISKIDIPAFIF